MCEGIETLEKEETAWNAFMLANRAMSVSYTHLDVYKRQLGYRVIGVMVNEEGEYEYSRSSLVRNTNISGCLKIVHGLILWHLVKKNMERQLNF